VERGDHASLGGAFFCEAVLEAGAVVALDDDLAHHLRVRRLEVGARIVLLDGAGGRAHATLTRVAKSAAEATIETLERIEPPPPVHMLVPVGDRDRMLWLAEKSVELAATSWRPVVWRRSLAVASRGDSEGFARKVRARMTGALGQSGGAWLPQTHPPADPIDAIAQLPVGGTRLAFRVDGVSALAATPSAPVTIVVGPEGGFEPDEWRLLLDSDFRPSALAVNILRFETAGVVALALVRAQLALSSRGD
jgi:16S rRNA (uracil1498-N3)-methyltransferase